MDNTTILSWNVRGLNARARRDSVRALTADVRPTIVALQETKLTVISRSTILGMLGVAYDDFAYLPATETRGGILIAARYPDVRLSDVLLGCFSVTVSVMTPTTAGAEPAKWWLTSVYGPQEDRDKVLFLEELEGIRDSCPGPWAIVAVMYLLYMMIDRAPSHNPLCI